MVTYSIKNTVRDQYFELNLIKYIGWYKQGEETLCSENLLTTYIIQY
jgi:hypothetical protein